MLCICIYPAPLAIRVHVSILVRHICVGRFSINCFKTPYGVRARYTKHQSQARAKTKKGHWPETGRVNAWMMLVTQLSLKSMETNREWGRNPFSSDSVLFNESCIASVIAALTLALTLTFGVNEPLGPIYTERKRKTSKNQQKISKCRRQTSKKIFAITIANARCKRTLTQLYEPFHCTIQELLATRHLVIQKCQ